MDRREKNAKLDIDRRKGERRVLSENVRNELSHYFSSIYLPVFNKTVSDIDPETTSEFGLIAAAMASSDFLAKRPKDLSQFAKAFVKQGFYLCYEDGSPVEESEINHDLLSA